MINETTMILRNVSVREFDFFGKKAFNEDKELVSSDQGKYFSSFDLPKLPEELEAFCSKVEKPCYSEDEGFFVLNLKNKRIPIVADPDGKKASLSDVLEDMIVNIKIVIGYTSYGGKSYTSARLVALKIQEDQSNSIGLVNFDEAIKDL